MTAIFRLVEQCLNQVRHRVSQLIVIYSVNTLCWPQLDHTDLNVNIKEHSCYGNPAVVPSNFAATSICTVLTLRQDSSTWYK